jgi:glutamyl-tRNA synthetase
MRDVPGIVDFLFVPPGTDLPIDQPSWDKAMGPDWAAPLLRDVIRAYSDVTWEAVELKAALEGAMQRYELKLGKAQAPVRVAVTGRSVGPPLFESLEVLGREESLKRLSSALARLERDGG